MYKDQYPQVTDPAIITIIEEEEQKFRKTLENAVPLMEKTIKGYLTLWRNGAGWRNEEVEIPSQALELYRKFQKESINDIAKSAFDLYQSHGVPEDVFIDMLMQGLKDEFSSLVFTLEDIQTIKEQFKNLKDQHSELSRNSSAGMFKGGLADSSEIVTQYHTTTHLLQQALRDVLGEHVFQRGSNITAERLRFDFSHPERLTEEQKNKIEQIVNEKIQQAIPVSFQMLPLSEAQKSGAIGLFGEKYPDMVKVYSIGPLPEGESIQPRQNVYSREFCGGPHVSNTSEIKGKFKIVKDEKIAKEITRIKAVLE
jgi:alanyl-tRNA synthetase